MTENKNQGEVTFTYSGILQKGNKKIIRVRFERRQGASLDYAEGCIPDCELTAYQGFDKEELAQMEKYLVSEKEHIIIEAKKLNNIKNWL